jgi:hypothetical protein
VIIWDDYTLSVVKNEEARIKKEQGRMKNEEGRMQNEKGRIEIYNLTSKTAPGLLPAAFFPSAFFLSASPRVEPH